MQITDIADAMIVKRLLTILLDMGVVLVMTSNRPPWGLYEGGINRDAFLPFVDALNERMVVIGMGGTHDYREDRAAVVDDASTHLPRYLCPTVDLAHPSRGDVIDAWFARGGGETRIENVPVVMGRTIAVSRANDCCAIFDFRELCDRPLGAADYIAISSRYDTIIVENVPRLTGDIYDCARRFVVLVDAAYEARTRLIIDAAVPRNELFVGFDAEVTTNDGDEEIAVEVDGKHVVGVRGNEQSMVVGEGGSSSSSSTTFLRTKDGDGRVEWSATGRIGVSLAQLSAVREVSFSFKRAESRLGEMASSSWGR
ncbi:hypothetical protein ACHAXA_005454 [Cyclostephanos tholiformis]|uniref:AFG1-like ATPase n=1 Tax=Cyclostephanos tholiformis TaxID=382380 RepID=A0ABD3SHE5_9STRA